MKKFVFAAAAIMAFFAVACTEEVRESLEITSSELNVSVDGGESPLSFSANSTWGISCDKDWVSFDKIEGEAGDVTVTMTVEANSDYEERTATVTITMGSKKSTITVKQAGIAEFAAETVYEIDASAQTIEFAITSNIEYSYKISEDASWITAVDSKAAPVESSLKFNVSANTDLFPRTGKIYVSAGDAVYCLVVKQNAEFEDMSAAVATYLSNTMKIYAGGYTSFDEYYIELSSDNGKTVGLAINTAIQESPLSGIPVGTYVSDAAGTHAENTFSMKTLDDSESLYTTIRNNGTETEVLDGEISVQKEGSVYTITAILVDGAGNNNRFSYQGEIATIEDKSFGAMLYSCGWKNTYYTYYASKANVWEISLCINRAPDENTPYLQYISFYVVGEAGDITGEELPVGTFTLATPETVGNYATGTLNAQAGTFYDFSGNDADQNTCEIQEGAKITVARNEDGTYNFTIDGSFRHYNLEYDEDWNEVITELGTFSYNETFENVKVSVDVTSQMKPMPDGDHVFSSVLANQYISLWYGNKWGIDNCNTHVIGLNNVDSNYTVYLCVNIEGDWTYEKNYANRFCNTPLPEVICTYSETAAANTLLPVYSGAALYCYVKNGYSGTTMPVCGGSVSIASTGLTFDLQATDGSETYKFTGTVPCAMSYANDYSSRASSLSIVSPNVK